ncbi:uncharacterized protein RHO25_003871 [Cercospora beticola]|uniref:F-box domain-containing protein n=1 Tax=Cercospora beticola TaxID=122368 RepID=A0ABZ0NIF5_CERBT|nr:hypothetical protein RHO25_003871 [Cercospora beticola]
MADSNPKRTRSQASGASNPPKRKRKPASYPMPKRRKTTPKKTKLPFIPAPLPPAAEGLQHAVFDTTELLENILVHLPVEDIYKVREVNKYWKEVIHTSPSILCKLFVNIQEPKRIWTKSFSSSSEKFKLAPSAPAPAAGGGGGSKPTTTKLSLVEGFEIREKMGLVGHLPILLNGLEKLNLRPVRLNPFLGILNCHIASQRSWASHERMTGDWVEEVEVSFNDVDRQRWRDWIGMEDSLFMSAQITDPPTRRVTFSQRVRGCVSHGEGCAVEARVDCDFECEEKFWRRGGGVMMKDVFRLLGLGLGVGRVIEGNETITSNEITRLGPVVRFAKMKGHDLRDEVQYVMRLHSSVVPSEEEWADMEKVEEGRAE